MKYTVEYVTSEQREAIIEANKDKTLIEEQNLLVPRPGKFLIFTDEPLIEEKLQDIKNNTDMLILKAEGII